MATVGLSLPDVIGEPWTGAEINDQMQRVHAESVAYWSQYATADFFRRPAPDVWAPVDQVRHLTKSMRAVSNGLKRSWPLLWFKFGRTSRPSMQCSKLSAWYEDVLKTRPSAGPFAPAPMEASQQNDAGRARVMEFHAVAVEEHCGFFARWSEAALDRWRLKHPLLGMLSLREFGFFTLLHNIHHVHVAEGRRANL